jgi:hypothetical protein
VRHFVLVNNSSAVPPHAAVSWDFFPTDPGIVPLASRRTAAYHRTINVSDKEVFGMERTSVTRGPGVAGMAGAVLWVVSVIMQHGLGIAGPDRGPLWVVHELVAQAALVGMVIGFAGLIWGGAFQGRLGAVGVGLYALGYALIVAASLLALALPTGTPESPVFLLFPIGGLLSDVGVVLIGSAVLGAGRWNGWQRWMPLLAAAYHILAIALPFFLGVTPDGPGALAALCWGVSWFLVSLAVYTAPAGVVALRRSAVGGA